MAAPDTPMHIPKTAQEGLLQFHKSCYQMLLQNWNLREQMRQIDLAYIREQDWTVEHRRATLANRYGDATKLQDITYPVVKPQVESAVAYQSSIFLSGYPIFESVAHPTLEDAAVQMNTIIEDQSTRGGWVRELQMFFRDGFKYNLSAVEVDWESIVTAAVETDLTYSATEAKPKSVIWSGNVLRRLDPYNLILDTRCTPTDIPTKGEFAGYTRLVSRVALKDFINKLPTKIIENVTEAFESGVGGPGNTAPETYYIPLINPNSLLNRNIRASTDWMAWASLANPNPTIQYKNLYELTVLYGRIIPSDFGLKVPAPNTPQVWKFIFVNNKVLIYAERQTNAHNLIPILFGQPYEDGLQYQTKSLAMDAVPFQQASSALLNQSMAASRKAIFDRTIYDPSRIREADINNPNPASKIPVRPAAYGKNVSEAIHIFPFRDDQSPVVMQKIQQLSAMADETIGRNRAQRGLFTKGNRTKEEYDSIMQNADGRDMLIAALYEAQVFTPLKEILKINILQYQGGTTLYSQSQQQPVAIDPITLRKAVLNFKMADGLEPVAKEISEDTLQVALQTIGSAPTLAAKYDVGAVFGYLLKTQGADLTPFEKPATQVAYEQAMQQWQAAVQQLTEAALKLGQQLDPSKLPPQPTPQQFNYVPGASNPAVTQPQPTVLQQVLSATAQTEGAAPNGSPTN